MTSAQLRFIVASTFAVCLAAGGLWACSAAPDDDVTDLQNDDSLSQPSRFTSQSPDAGAAVDDASN